LVDGEVRKVLVIGWWEDEENELVIGWWEDEKDARDWLVGR